MKVFLNNDFYEETQLRTSKLSTSLLKCEISRAEAVDEFNNILVRVTAQNQVDQWKLQENNCLLFPDTTESTGEVKEKLKNIRQLIRDLIYNEMSVYSPVEVIGLLFKNYIKNFSFISSLLAMDKREYLKHPLQDVVKGGLQQLSNDYRFEVTVNYYPCSKLLEIKKFSVEITLEKFLGVNVEEFCEKFLA